MPARWVVGAGKFLLLLTVGLVILAYAVPVLAMVALAFLGLIVLAFLVTLLYGMIKLRQFRREMRRLGQTFSQQTGQDPGHPFAGNASPQRPRQRVQCKVREVRKPPPEDTNNSDDPETR